MSTFAFRPTYLGAFLLASLALFAHAELWALSAGDTVTSSVVLDKDLATSWNFCLNVGADNITIDGNGHALTYTGNAGALPGSMYSGSAGIKVSGFKNVVIKNFSMISGFDVGVSVLGGEKVTIENCTIEGNVFAGILADSANLTVRGNSIREVHTAAYLGASTGVVFSGNSAIGGRVAVQMATNGGFTTFTNNQLHHQSQSPIAANRRLFRFGSFARVHAVGHAVAFSFKTYEIGGALASASSYAIRTVPAVPVSSSKSGSSVSGSFVPARPGLHALIVEVRDPHGNKETRLARVFAGPTATRSVPYYWGERWPVHGQTPRGGFDTAGMLLVPPAQEGYVDCGGWVQESPDQLPVLPAAMLSKAEFQLLFKFDPDTDGVKLLLERDVTFGLHGDRSVSIPKSLGTGSHVWGTFPVSNLNWCLDYPLEWYFLAAKFVAPVGDPQVQTGRPGQMSQTIFDCTVSTSPEVKAVSNPQLLLLGATADSAGMKGETITVWGGQAERAELVLAHHRRPFLGVITRLEASGDARFATGSVSGEKTFSAVPLDIAPSQNAVNASVTAWPGAQDGVRKWSLAAAGSPGKVRHTVKDLPPLSTWDVTVNGGRFLSIQADTQGALSFLYDGAFPAAIEMSRAVSNKAPVIESAPWADPNPVRLPGATTVHVVASDPDNGPQVLVYTWSKLSGPGVVTFSPNGTTQSDASTASFSAAGTYTLRVSVSDGAASVSGNVTVTVHARAPDPSEMIVDNQDAHTAKTGAWKISSAADPYAGQSLYSNSGSSFRWLPEWPADGTYEVYAWWTYHPNRSSRVPFRIAHSAGLATVHVNMRDASMAAKWNRLGTFPRDLNIMIYHRQRGKGSSLILFL